MQASAAKYATHTGTEIKLNCKFCYSDKFICYKYGACVSLDILSVPTVLKPQVTCIELDVFRIKTITVDDIFLHQNSQWKFCVTAARAVRIAA